jgi:hypothetical protein
MTSGRDIFLESIIKRSVFDTVEPSLFVEIAQELTNFPFFQFRLVGSRLQKFDEFWVEVIIDFSLAHPLQIDNTDIHMPGQHSCLRPDR